MTPIPDKSLDLDELEKMLKEATPGPWYVRPGCDGIHNKTVNVFVSGFEPENTALITTLRNAAPALLDLVRKADAWLEAFEARGDNGIRLQEAAAEYRKARQKAGGKGDG